MDLYFDGFCCIGIREDTGSGYYSDISMGYFVNKELSAILSIVDCGGSGGFIIGAGFDVNCVV